MGVVIGVILILLSLGCALISVRQFLEKGFLFNNAYLWATKAEREKLDKKPYYRQSAVVFALLAVMLLLLGLECFLETGFLMVLMYLLAVVAVVYAIVSAVRIELRRK